MNTLARYQFTVYITFIAPIISQSSGASRIGLDSAMLCNREGKPAIPGTLIQGNLRYYWQELSGKSSDKTLGLGNSHQDGTPQRGHLNFSEFWVYNDSASKIQAGLQHRIKIDDASGKTETGALQTIESLFLAGESVSFKGDIFGWFKDDSAADDFKIGITRSLLYMPAAGSFKGIGFGRVKDVTVHSQPINIARCDDQIGLVIKPDRAFCFSRHLAGNNTRSNNSKSDGKTDLDNNYVSEDFIPGGAIKGSIATLLRLSSGQQKCTGGIEHPDFPLLSQYLDQIVFTHAQPVANGQQHTCKRNHALPKSIVMAENKFYDIAQKDKPGLINGEAPKFATEWKSREWAIAGEDETLNLPAYLRDSRSLILHTEIDRKSGASKDHQLFSIEAVNPDDHQWHANITLPETLTDNDDKKALIAELQYLLTKGLHWLGKTEASATVTLREQPFLIPGTHAITPGQQSITITLLSAACLLPIGTTIPSTNGGGELLQAYKESWTELSEGSLELIRFYAEQQLVGGSYLHERFGPGKPYNPRIFTTAGSVFVFAVTVTDFDKAKKHLDNWSKTGLPQLKVFSDKWQENPYIAPNGYGEIAVNLATAPEPENNEWQPIEEINA